MDTAGLANSDEGTNNNTYAIRPIVEIDLTKVYLGESGDGTSSSPYSITAR